MKFCDKDFGQTRKTGKRRLKYPRESGRGEDVQPLKLTCDRNTPSPDVGSKRVGI